MCALRTAGGKSPEKVLEEVTPKRVLLDSVSSSTNAFPRSAAHVEMAALGQNPAMRCHGCRLASRITKAPGFRGPGFILVNAQFFCSNGFNRKCFRKAPVFLPLHSCLDLPHFIPSLMDPSTSQFNNVLFRLKAALVTPTNVLS